MYLQLGIKEAWKYQLLTYPNPAVGCVVVKNNKILAVAAHQEAGGPHAEVLALKEAFLQLYPDSELKYLKKSIDIHTFLIKNHNNVFRDCDIYVTLEPCAHYGKTPACANLLSIVKPKKVIIGQLDPNKKASGGVEILKRSSIEVEIRNSVDSYKLIEPFIKWQKNKFVFFKLAQTLNGVINGGYISNNSSLDWVHKIRTKIDLLVIGGNTVRIDRPTLDARRISKIGSDILIYSKNKEFDKNIPLFNVPNRRVYIENNLKKINDYKFVMIEGGYNMYSSLKDIIDMKVFIVSPFMKRGNYFEVEDDLDILNVTLKDDIFIFAK